MSRSPHSEFGSAVAEVEGLLGDAWRTVLACSPESVWVLSPAAQVMYFNHHELMAMDIVGRSSLDFLKPEFHLEYERNLARVIEFGETVEFDFHSVVGQVWEQRFVPMRDQVGEIRWAIAFGRLVDSSTRQHGGRLLAGQLDIALDTTGMGLWRLDARGDTISLDVRSSVIHGLAPSSGVHTSIAEFIELVHVEDRARLQHALTDASAGGFRDLEYRRVFSDGSVRWISCSGTFLAGAHAGQVAAIGSCFDITERKLVSQQLVQAQKMEAIGQLTAGIAHNFNNILGAILPNLHLASRFVSADGAKFVRNAHLAAERATDLVSELMVVAGRKESQARQPLDLYQVCERVTRICRTTFGGWVQLNLSCEEACPLVLGNESQLEQVLLNLLLNSRDAFEEASISCPRIDIEVDTGKGDGGIADAVLRVIDNGPGISDATLERIFEPFFTTKGAGTGLGLATAYAIVTEHGGSISCWSKLERGTRFEVSLPGYEGEISAELPPIVAAFVGGTERILVVDDDNLVRRVTTAALRDAGYDVIEAAGGSEAISVHRDGPIDLVVLDMAMPELTGDQVLLALRSHDPGTKVLIFTGLATFRQAKLERVAVLQKPAGINDLLQAVRREIDKTTIN